MAHDAGDVSKVLEYGRSSGTPVVFRAGGTSLNGQGQSDGILVDVRRHFGGVSVEDGGRWPGSGRGRSSATPTASSPPTGASSAPTRPAPTSPPSAG